ncbi:MAG: hypothetical protein WC796_00505 [Candidatus Pacearchaeota archaeon]|jgi:hypothetical protein
MISKIHKKAQEEMVGFVVIVVIVIVVGLIFLVISFRSNGNLAGESSNRLDSFVKSVGYYTTDCEITKSHYENIESLIAGCHDGKQCVSGEGACEKLTNVLKGILNNSFVVTGKSYVIYYNLDLRAGKVIKENTTSIGESIIAPISAGNISLGEDGLKNCPGLRLTKDRSFSAGSSSQKAVMRLEVCYSLVS